MGKIGAWTFRRAWYYWIVGVEHKQEGLPVAVATELHNKKHPTEDKNLGEVIRCGGHCGCPAPEEYGAQPVQCKELDEKLIELGYEQKSMKLSDKEVEYIDINVGEISKICNEGKLKVERYVDCYHIDDQVGLNEFVKAIQK